MNKRNDAPCRSCDEEEVCTKPCEEFAAWFRERWRALRELLRR